MTSPVCFLTKMLLVVSLCLVAGPLVPAQILTTLHNFNGTDGVGPVGNLVQGRDGTLRGTTFGDGRTFLGTAFAMKPDASLIKYVTFNGSNGSFPASGVVLGTDNNFYGTTYNGGSDDDGVVFKMSPKGAITVLVNFDGNNGWLPTGSLVQGTDGNFYGTTFWGGNLTNCPPVGCGTIFRTTPSGALTMLHNFDVTDGVNPQAGLVEGPDGCFYGATENGGCASGCFGTVFRITSAGQFTVIHAFSGNDGSSPQAPLVWATDGNFYGTTNTSVFKISPKGTFTNLYTFTGQQVIAAGLTEGTDGNFYGVTMEGGSGNCFPTGCGMIFQISPSGVLTTLYNFSGPDGAGPFGAPLQHTNGKFYGTTRGGGQYNDGTIFSLDMGFGPFITFVSRFSQVGLGVQILGQGFTGATSVTFDGIPATTFNVASDTFMEAIVPPGATSGPVQVTTHSGVLTSNVNLQIVP